MRLPAEGLGGCGRRPVGGFTQRFRRGRFLRVRDCCIHAQFGLPQRGNIIQPRVGPQRGTTLGIVIKILPNPNGVAAFRCRVDTTPLEMSAKVVFVVAAVCDRRASFGFPRTDGGRRPPLQAFAEISVGVGAIADTYPGVVPRCGPTPG